MAKKKPKSKNNKAEDVEGVKKKLGVKDRLLVLNELLPKQGNIIDLTIAKDIRGKVAIGQAEMTKLEMKKTDEGLKWEDKGQIKTIGFSNAEIELLRTQVADLDKQKKITAELLDLCLLIKK